MQLFSVLRWLIWINLMVEQVIAVAGFVGVTLLVVALQRLAEFDCY
jgi:hypothetical protein